MKYDSCDICQTHYVTGWVRNPAALLVIAVGALDFFIAPVLKNVTLTLWSILTHCVMKYIYKFTICAPHGSLRKKLPFLVIFWAYHQEWNFADVPLVSSEYTFLQVLLLTLFLVHPILTLNMIVAEEFLCQADLHTRPPPVSGCAHQVILAAFLLICQLDFTAAISALVWA